MTTFLHKNLIIGILKSRRLGYSFGINISPITRKICNFDCIYCECGKNICEYTETENNNSFCTIEQFTSEMELSLQYHKKNNLQIDSITFSGNGEPSLHPNFSEIIDETIRLRNKYYPKVKISVLTNSTKLNEKTVVNALQKIENPILKIDTVSQELFEIINLGKFNDSIKKQSSLTINNIIKDIKTKFKNPIIQTMLIKSNLTEKSFNNSSEDETKKYIEKLIELKPKLVMLYSIDRDTAISGLEKISYEKMEEIASQLKKYNIISTIS